MYDLKKGLHRRQEKHRKGQLRTVALDSTFSCNMNCKHCYAEPFVNKVKPIALSHLKRALDEFYELGVFHYVLQGGEPVVDIDRLEFVLKNCRPDETYINIISNGWAMPLETIRRLKELKTDKITFSLDSGLLEEHDRNRRKGSYRKTLQAIEDVKSEGLITGISTVVTHVSLYSESFSILMEFARKNEIRLHIQIAEPVGNWEGRKDLLMTAEDTKYLRGLFVEAPTLPNGQKLIHRDLYAEDGDYCPAGTEFLSLTADGELFTCNFLQHSLGNIKERSIADMREMILKSPWFDGKHPLCLCGEDEEFMEKFITPYDGKPKPLNAEEVFGLKYTDRGA